MHRNEVLQTGESLGAPTQGSPGPRNRILVVDDDRLIRLLSAAVLVHSGYQVDTAEDGEAGWEALQAKSYDLLITDNNMPKVSGLELVEKLRSKNTALPVILVSGAIPTEELNRHPWLQLDATLLKPFTDDGLLGTVKRVLRETNNPRKEMRRYLPPRKVRRPSTRKLQPRLTSACSSR
jgi:DNA-binding response OmpR family regulator